MHSLDVKARPRVPNGRDTGKLFEPLSDSAQTVPRGAVAAVTPLPVSSGLHLL